MQFHKKAIVKLDVYRELDWTSVPTWQDEFRSPPLK